MQFDTLNQLLTSTVFDLFNNSQTIVYESKDKVKELQGMSRQDSVIRNSQSRMLGQSFNLSSEREERSEGSSGSIRIYRTIAEWTQIEAPRRLADSFKKLSLEPSLLSPEKKHDLQRYINAMNQDQLTNEKKKVKNYLRCYDNDFIASFTRQPNHKEKEPFRPLYGYYKRLKEQITKRGIEEISSERIDQMIKNIRQERKELREKIEKYQTDFERANNRRIRYLRDIAPIDNEYKKYKELKFELAKYQDMKKNDN